jgi:hypothetical protein
MRPYSLASPRGTFGIGPQSGVGRGVQNLLDRRHAEFGNSHFGHLATQIERRFYGA